MDRLIHVQGDHPIFAYVDKYLWNPDDVKKLVEELQSYNYENIKVDGKEIPNGQ
jgi:hypothetical protein